MLDKKKKKGNDTYNKDIKDNDLCFKSDKQKNKETNTKKNKIPKQKQLKKDYSFNQKTLKENSNPTSYRNDVYSPSLNINKISKFHHNSSFGHFENIYIKNSSPFTNKSSQISSETMVNSQKKLKNIVNFKQNFFSKVNNSKNSNILINKSVTKNLEEEEEEIEDIDENNVFDNNFCMTSVKRKKNDDPKKMICNSVIINKEEAMNYLSNKKYENELENEYKNSKYKRLNMKLNQINNNNNNNNFNVNETENNNKTKKTMIYTKVRPKLTILNSAINSKNQIENIKFLF